jgi:hypothetical protein
MLIIYCLISRRKFLWINCRNMCWLLRNYRALFDLLIRKKQRWKRISEWYKTAGFAQEFHASRMTIISKKKIAEFRIQFLKANMNHSNVKFIWQSLIRFLPTINMRWRKFKNSFDCLWVINRVLFLMLAKKKFFFSLKRFTCLRMLNKFITLIRLHPYVVINFINIFFVEFEKSNF